MSVARTRQLLALRQRRSQQARLAFSAQTTRVHHQEREITETQASIDAHRQRQTHQEATLARRLEKVSLSGREIAASRQAIDALAFEENELLARLQDNRHTLSQARASQRELAQALAARDREVAAVEQLLQRERNDVARWHRARAEDDPGEYG